MLININHAKPSNEELGIKVLSRRYAYPLIGLASLILWSVLIAVFT